MIAATVELAGLSVLQLGKGFEFIAEVTGEHAQRLRLPEPAADAQHASTATGADWRALQRIPWDGDLRRWTPVDGLPADVMQEVWGSNPHSSTSQFKAINSNKRRPGARAPR